MTWLAESLHAVFFVNPAAASPDALQPWLRIFGSPPQSYQSSPPGGPQTANSQGLIGEYNVVISSQIGRTEVAVSSAPNQGDLPKGIEDYQTALSTLKGYGSKLYPEATTRVALVANFSRIAKDAGEAEAFLRADVPLLSQLTLAASDVQFGLNIRKDVAELGTAQNRLVRWSTAVQQIYLMQVTMGSAEPTMVVQEKHVELMTIDINSGNVSNPNELLTSKVLHHFCDEAAQIVSGGYSYLVD